MEPIALAALLLALAIALFIVEVFIPSGGLIMIAGLAAAGLSLYFAFSEGVVTGMVFLVVGLAGTFAGVSVSFWALPRTRFGKRLLLITEPRPPTLAGADALDYGELLGRRGVATSALRPSGTVVFGDYRVSVVTEGDMVDAGATVIVVEVEGNRVVVRVDDEEPDARS